MNAFPIIVRELAVASRKPMTQWSRAGVALVAGTVTVWTLGKLSTGTASGSVGLELFRLLANIGYAVCLLPGIFLTADCLSHEKREGTLGLLFLSNLRGGDVLFGKLGATSLNSVFGLWAALPMLAIPLLLGGVSAGDYVRVALALVNTLWVSLATGLFISAVSWRQQRAMAATAACLVLSGVVLPTLGFPWFLLSPRAPLKLAYWNGSLSTQFFYVATLLVTHAYGWILLAVAHDAVQRSWREPGPASLESEDPKRTVQRDLTAWSAEARVELARHYARMDWSQRMRMLERNPVEWLAGVQQQWGVWTWTGVGIIVCVAGDLASGGRWETSMTGVLALLGLHGLLKVWVAWEASRRCTEARRLGVLELLLVTPLGSPAILRGQWKSLARKFAGPVLAVIAFDLLLLLAAPGAGAAQHGILRAVVASTMVMFVVDLLALVWLGLRLGLSTGKALPSAAQCVAWVMGLPTILTLGLIIGAETQPIPTQLFGLPFCVAAWLLFGLAVSLWLGLKAREDLIHRFRRLAAGC